MAVVRFTDDPARDAELYDYELELERLLREIKEREDEDNDSEQP